MKLLSRILLAAVLTIAGTAFAQEEMPGDAPPDQPGLPADGTVAPPPDQAPAESANDSDGQWTYTDQYGWVWIPYAQQYTYVAPSGDTAYEYCYDQTSGWTWLASPWVLGYGPMPYWGGGGVGRFAWYSHPWFAARGGSGYRSGSRSGYASGAGRSSAVHGATPVTPAPTQQVRRIPRGSAPPHSGGGFHSGGSRR